MDSSRKNINRGFIRLRVFQDALLLYKTVYEITNNLPYSLSKSRNNILDAANSILRNIGEGYCRRNLKEYLNFLNIALGSCGETISGILSFRVINVITSEDFEKFDELHFKVENQLLGLIKSLQQKQRDGDWDTSFVKEESPEWITE